MAAIIRIERSRSGWSYVIAATDGACTMSITLPEGQLRALIGDATALLAGEDLDIPTPSIGEMLAHNVKPLSDVLDRR